MIRRESFCIYEVSSCRCLRSVRVVKLNDIDGCANNSAIATVTATIKALLTFVVHADNVVSRCPRHKVK